MTMALICPKSQRISLPHYIEFFQIKPVKMEKKMKSKAASKRRKRDAVFLIGRKASTNLEGCQKYIGPTRRDSGELVKNMFDKL